LVTRTAAPLGELQRRHSGRAAAVPGKVADSSAVKRAIRAARGCVGKHVFGRGVLSGERGTQLKCGTGRAGTVSTTRGVKYSSELE
jgi:hypothetical protein